MNEMYLRNQSRATCGADLGKCTSKIRLYVGTLDCQRNRRLREKKIPPKMGKIDPAG